MKKKILQISLENAVEFKGKCSKKAIINKIIPLIKDKSKLKKISKDVDIVIDQVNNMSLSDQIIELKKLNPKFFDKKEKIKKKIVDLPNVKKIFRVRSAPSASGPLHIGHALVLSINKIYRDLYGGAHILRIEDTNPEANFKEFYSMIKKDFTWLVGKPDEIYVQSDRIENYYNIAEKLIKKGKLYFCNENSEVIRKKIRKGEKPIGASSSVKSNLENWKKMLKGEYDAGEGVMRVNTPDNLKNPALRDWIAFRINKSKHPKTRSKYCVWPMMNFSVAVDDHELKITHVIRGKDHEDQTRRQSNIFEYMNWKTPEYIHLGRINYEGMNISASEIRKGVESGKFDGYDDKRVETLSSLRKRNYKPDAIIKFFYEIGPTKRDKTFKKQEVYKTLDSFNRKIIE